MTDSPAAEIGPFQVVVLVLSVFVLIVLGVELVVPFDPEVDRLIGFIDTAICGVLLLDFGVRFRRAESKLAFMKWGWIDLLASVPAVDIFRLGRALRVLRVLRILRAMRSLRAFLSMVFKRRSTGGLATAATVAFLALSLASLAILVVERKAGGNITTASDALWWALTTVTTVGYGDRFPVTDLGRAVAAMLMLVGVGLFGTLSGAVASVFLGEGEPKQDDPLQQEVAALRVELAALRGALPAREPGADGGP
jgi:voltage-gated potassium channel